MNKEQLKKIIEDDSMMISSVMKSLLEDLNETGRKKVIQKYNLVEVDGKWVGYSNDDIIYCEYTLEGDSIRSYKYEIIDKNYINDITSFEEKKIIAKTYNTLFLNFSSDVNKA